MTDRPPLLSCTAAEESGSLKYMLKLAAPMVVTTMSLTLMQFVDRFMVSRLGTSSLAAVLPASFAGFLPGSFAIGAIASLNTFVSQSLGRGEKTECPCYFWQVVWMGVAYFLVVMAVMWPTAPQIFRLMGQPPGVIPQEVIYFRIMLYAHIPAVINWASNQFFMGIHRPVVTMCTSFCGQVVNVIVNYLLIFGKFGFPRMEIAGAGWGTFIGISVASAVNMAVFLSGRTNRDFKPRRSLKLDFGKIYDLLKVGLPAGLGQMLNVSLWGMILLGLVGRFGQEVLAATSAVLSYAGLSSMPVVGMSIALSAAVGKSIGQGRKDLAGRQTNLCLQIGLIYMGLVGLCFFLLRNKLVVFWSSDARVIEAGVNMLICAAVYQVFDAARIVYGGSLRGAGDTLWPAVVSAVGAVLILGLGGWCVTKLFPATAYMGPWVMSAVSIAGIGVANCWRFKSNRWMSIDLFARRAVPLPMEIG